MAKFTVIGGNASQDLAKRLARKLKATYINTELRAFPDGENKITLSAKPKKNRIIVVQSAYPPVDSNLIQCLSLISKAKQFSSNVIAVVPYMGYARQDREFLPGEVVSMQVIAKDSLRPCLMYVTLGVILYIKPLYPLGSVTLSPRLTILSFLIIMYAK